MKAISKPVSLDVGRLSRSKLRPFAFGAIHKIFHSDHFDVAGRAKLFIEFLAIGQDCFFPEEVVA